MCITSHSQVQQLVTQEQELPNPDDMEVTPPESDIMEITPTPGIYVCRGNIYVLLDLCTYLSCFIKVFMSSTLLITLFLKFLYCTQDSAVMKTIQLACKWVEENQHHFAGKIELPKILRMKEDDALLAITMRNLFINTMFYEGERDEEQIQAPFLFTFLRVEDMEYFLQEIRDKKDIRVSCLHDPLL